MTLPLIALAFLALLAIGYRLHSARIARAIGLDESRQTPAHLHADGVDFVPTRPFYLFGQHFSAIAAAGPIAGPILACKAFGWLPCLVWIAIGVVFIGAVHDFLALAASLRHGAKSLAEITRAQLGAPAGRALLGFLLLSLVYVVVAFTDTTALTFLAGDEAFQGMATPFNPGGAVAIASLLYLLLGLVLGVVQKAAPRVPLWLLTLLFVPATFVLCWSGTLPRASQWLALEPSSGYRTWCFAILAYCGIASLLPVWLLLQPRGYLGGFILYSALAAGAIGIVLGESKGGFIIEQPAFRGFDVGGPTGMLFPFLFVTIACGACSGFHGLVCSGTTSKQVERESHARPIGYGAMLAEAFVALIALMIVMTAKPESVAGASPGKIYGDGIGRFLTLVVGTEHQRFVTTFGAMAFSTFVFDTLDVCTRLGRHLVAELFGLKGRAGATIATVATLLPPAAILAFAQPGDSKHFWTLFGASNQLLAALTLLTLAVWLRKSGRRIAFVIWPMAFVLITTVIALGSLAWSNFGAAAAKWRTGGGVGGLVGVEFGNGLASVLLLVLAGFLVTQAWPRLRAAPENR
ncbi:MAG: carbon starvation protein A [Planctomycetes bacterium]|nr:carbon starvation protein A [Planctomycetota bacterium]